MNHLARRCAQSGLVYSKTRLFARTPALLRSYATGAPVRSNPVAAAGNPEEGPVKSQDQDKSRDRHGLDIWTSEVGVLKERYQGISSEPFSKEVQEILLKPLESVEIEIKPDGMLYLPEIKYRRILNKAFGPGGWAMMPLNAPVIERGNLIRTYALYCFGRFVAEAIGENQYFENVHSTATAAEGAKSNALMRCCKDIGIGSELWDPTFCDSWRKQWAVELFVEHAVQKTKKKVWRRKDKTLAYPYIESKPSSYGTQGSTQTPAYSQAYSQTPTFRQSPPAVKSTPEPLEQPEEPAAAEEESAPAPVSALNPPARAAPPTRSPYNKGPSASAIDLTGMVPASFKKFAGKTWREFLQDSKSAPYLEFLATTGNQMAKEVVAKVSELGVEGYLQTQGA